MKKLMKNLSCLNINNKINTMYFFYINKFDFFIETVNKSILNIFEIIIIIFYININ